MMSEVFKLALAIIIAAAVLSLFANLFAGLHSAGTESMNTTTTVLTNLSDNLLRQVASF